MNERRQSTEVPKSLRSSRPSGGKCCSHLVGSANAGSSASSRPIFLSVSHWYTFLVDVPILPFFALDFFAMSSSADLAAAGAPASSASAGNAGGLPYVAISSLSLFAAAWIGMPVQWKPNGNSTLSPLSRWYAAANSALVSENAWPRWSRPFMYGYGNVTMNLGRGAPLASYLGATSNVFSASHCARTACSSFASRSRRAEPFGAAAAAPASAPALGGGGGFAGLPPPTSIAANLAVGTTLNPSASSGAPGFAPSTLGSQLAINTGVCVQARAPRRDNQQE